LLSGNLFRTENEKAKPLHHIAAASQLCPFFVHNTLFFRESSDTQLSEISIVQGLLPALRLPLKEIKKKSISYSSKERQVFASLIKSNSAVSVLVQPQFDPQPHQCCFYTEKKTLHWIATAFIMFI
jgi:hypothetical protein